VDFARHVQEQFEHLLRMARMKGARDHAKLRCQELEALDPMYRGMEERVRQALASESLSRTRPASTPTTAPCKAAS
jgi:hypothetical protein